MTATSPLPPRAPPAAAGASWTMIPWNGSAMYRVKISGLVSSDSSGERTVAVSAEESETLTRAPARRGVSFTLSLATFDVGPRTSTAVEKVSGLLVGAQLTFESSAGTPACDPKRARLRADLADLAFPVTETVALGENWSDSVSNEVCVSGISGVARTRRHFIAVGDTTLGGGRAVIIQRTDSTNLSGEGALDRHKVSLAAAGLASARLYLSIPDGRILRIGKEQLLNIIVTSTSHTKTFLQKSTSVAELGR